MMLEVVDDQGCHWHAFHISTLVSRTVQCDVCGKRLKNGWCCGNTTLCGEHFLAHRNPSRPIPACGEVVYATAITWKQKDRAVRDGMTVEEAFSNFT